jgi:hypothetical protein
MIWSDHPVTERHTLEIRRKHIPKTLITYIKIRNIRYITNYCNLELLGNAEET